jgi:hypothetical protein
MTENAEIPRFGDLVMCGLEAPGGRTARVCGGEHEHVCYLQGLWWVAVDSAGFGGHFDSKYVWGHYVIGRDPEIPRC